MAREQKTSHAFTSQPQLIKGWFSKASEEDGREIHMRALCHVSVAIRSKLNHFNAHVRQLHIHPEGGRKRHIQCGLCQNMGRSKSLESQTTIPNWAHGDPDIAHFINTFLKTCRRTPWTTSDPIPVIYLL